MTFKDTLSKEIAKKDAQDTAKTKARDERKEYVLQTEYKANLENKKMRRIALKYLAKKFDIKETDLDKFALVAPSDRPDWFSGSLLTLLTYEATNVWFLVRPKGFQKDFYLHFSKGSLIPMLSADGTFPRFLVSLRANGLFYDNEGQVKAGEEMIGFPVYIGRIKKITDFAKFK